jgi:hypothetical protein
MVNMIHPKLSLSIFDRQQHCVKDHSGMDVIPYVLLSRTNEHTLSSSDHHGELSSQVGNDGVIENVFGGGSLGRDNDVALWLGSNDLTSSNLNSPLFVTPEGHV